MRLSASIGTGSLATRPIVGILYILNCEWREWLLHTSQ
jgi:hypothetical protein